MNDERVRELLDLMTLEPLEVNLFRGDSRDIGTPRVFGGQVLAQALLAASQTVEDRMVHSLHAYFRRAGDPDAPIVYSVDRSRDGRSFTARRVGGELRIDEDELEDAGWFERVAMGELIESGELRLPSRVSIARRLIEDWLKVS